MTEQEIDTELPYAPHNEMTAKVYGSGIVVTIHLKNKTSSWIEFTPRQLSVVIWMMVKALMLSLWPTKKPARPPSYQVTP